MNHIVKGLNMLGALLFSSIGVFAEEPIVIAHRGASGYLPEHTIEAYKLGIEQGADFIEPDLVMTKDGVLVARHDIYLSTTTNVASKPEFADRRRIIGDKSDWFVMDFTLDELKTLKARQPFPGRDKSFDDQLEIATFDEIVSLVLEQKAAGKTVGLHIEMKRPDLFKTNVASDLADVLSNEFSGLIENEIPIYFQCFDGDFVKEMSPLTGAPIVLLVGGEYNRQTKWFDLGINPDEFYDYVAGFGLNKALLFNSDMQPNGLVEKLHMAEKIVHIWTARNDALPEGIVSPEQELTMLFATGIDGIFTDFPGTAVKVRDTLKTD